MEAQTRKALVRTMIIEYADGFLDGDEEEDFPLASTPTERLVLGIAEFIVAELSTPDEQTNKTIERQQT